MITDAFDAGATPIISPGDFYGEKRELADICLITFSKEIYKQALREFDCEKIAEIGLCNGNRPIYALTRRGRRIAFYLSPVGAAAAGHCLIEANWLTGASAFISFGSAGSLNQQKTRGKYVIPMEAYRDEGMSYHYAPPSDYIRISGAERLCEIFNSLQQPFVKGRLWTTDAIYRETREALARRTEEDCLAVDMEISGLQAVCDFHGFQLYPFVVTGDVLDQAEYDVAELDSANHEFSKFQLALDIADKIRES